MRTILSLLAIILTHVDAPSARVRIALLMHRHGAYDEADAGDLDRLRDLPQDQGADDGGRRGQE